MQKRKDRNLLTKFNTYLGLKRTSESRVDGNYLNILNAMYDKPTANTILSGEKLNIFSLRSRIRQGSPFSSLLFNIVLEVLTTAIGEEKETKYKLGREN